MSEDEEKLLLIRRIRELADEIFENLKPILEYEEDATPEALESDDTELKLKL